MLTRRLSSSVALRELRLFSGQWPGSEEELGSSPCPALHCSLLTFASSQHLAQFFFGDSFPGAWKPFCDFLTFYETVFFWLLRGCATGRCCWSPWHQEEDNNVLSAAQPSSAKEQFSSLFGAFAFSPVPSFLVSIWQWSQSAIGKHYSGLLWQPCC